MTSQPIRPDGDGLLRNALVEARAALASLDHMNGSESGLAVIRGGKTIQKIIDDALAAHPSTNGAEGAGECPVCNDFTPNCWPQDCPRRAAQPQPAPDAMRGALRAIEDARQVIVLTIAFLGRDLGSERAGATIKSLIGILARADAKLRAFSAPVPSPDALEELRCEIEEHRAWGRLAAAHVPLPDGAVTFAEHFDRLPSGAGAAEPVAASTARMTELARQLRLVATECRRHEMHGCGSTLHHIADQISAAPPVRGDREILESIADWCSTERAKIGAVDGYDYHSGEEFGLRCAEIEIKKRSLSLPSAQVSTPQQVQEACAQVADRAAQQDEDYAAKYPDEAHKFDQRAHRAKTIAISIRALIPPAPVSGRDAAIEEVSKRLVQMADNMGGMHEPELKRLARSLSNHKESGR